MKKVIIKQWIYVEAQTNAQRYNFTLVWDKMHIEDELSDGWNPKDTFALYGEVSRETEKAVLLECDYWNLNGHFRDVTSAPRCKGFKVWLPKSAILEIKRR